MTLASRVLLCGLILAAATVAQLPPPSHYTASGIGGEANGSVPNGSYFVSFSETDLKGKNTSDGAWVNFNMCSYTPPGTTGMYQSTCMTASGPIPVAMISKKGDTVTLNIPDVAALPFPFYVYGDVCDMYGCVPMPPLTPPWPLRVVLTSTGDITVEEDTSRTITQRLTDGSVWREKSRGDSTWTIAQGSGVAGPTTLGPTYYGRITFTRNAYRVVTHDKK